MRDLTAKQKKILDKWVNSQIEKDDTQKMIHDNAPFTRGRYNLSIEDFPADLYNQLEEINDTEILYQNVDRYLQDKAYDISMGKV